MGSLYCWVSMFTVIREVEIGLRPDTLLPITIVKYTFPTQDSLNMLFLEGCDDKWFKTIIKYVAYIHIKMTRIVIFRACQHTLFVHFHISLIFLFMHLMELNTIRIYDPLDVYIFHHPVFFPPICHQTYFLLICLIIPQLGWLNIGGIRGINYQIYWREIGGNIGEVGNTRHLRNLSKVMKLRDKMKEVLLLHQTITPLLIFLKTRRLLIYQWVL